MDISDHDQKVVIDLIEKRQRNQTWHISIPLDENQNTATIHYIN